MTRKTCPRAVFAALTLTLLACEQSITDVPDPVVTEAVSSVAETHDPGDPGNPLVAHWAAVGDPLPVVNSHDPGINDIGTIQGVTATDGGVVDKAFLFTGAPGGPDQFLEIPQDVAGLLRPEEFTIDLWAQRIGEGQDPTGGLIQKPLNDLGFNGPGHTYFIFWNPDGRIMADVAFNPTPVVGQMLSTTAVGDGEWAHVALTVGPPDLVDFKRTATLYVNGAVEAAFEGGSGENLVYGNLGSIVIGNNWRWARDPSVAGNAFKAGFNGCIDEIRISDRALGLSEIEAIYGGGVTGTCPGPPPPPPSENTAPTVDLTQVDVTAIDEGDTFASSAGFFTDPDDDAWLATVDYGDGGGSEALTLLPDKSFTLSHAYADEGTYEITVTVDDQVADPVSAAISIVVNNVAPSVSNPDDAVILEGDTYTSSVTVTDPGADFWTVDIAYGDGTGETQTFDGTVPSWPGGPTTVDLSHVYGTNEQCGPFTVTVTVDDGDGGEDSSNAQVTVHHEISVEKANVTLNRRRRPGRDRYNVEGRLPASLVSCVDASDPVTVEFAGLALQIPAGALVRRDRRRVHKWLFRAGGRSAGIRTFELHDDGRFKINARRLTFDHTRADFPRPADFSISFGADVGVDEIELDRRLRLQRQRRPRGQSDKSGKSDSSAKSDKSEKSGWFRW